MASQQAALQNNTDADITNQDILKATQIFTDLRRSTDTYTFRNGTCKELRCLKGTVPITVKGNTWDIPLCLWLMETHPHIPPVCYIKPTRPVHLRPSQHISDNGRVYHSYLHGWKHPESDLVGLLQTLVLDFGNIPPVYIIQDTDADITNRDILNACQNFTDLRPSTSTHTFMDGTSKALRCIKGTVPIIMKGNTWNIPLCLWLMETHPHIPPVCQIKPTSPMHLRPSHHIYDNGKVYHSYLQGWKHPESDLVGLLETLVKDFGKIPPVYIIQKTDADETNEDILNACQNFTDLRQSTDMYTFMDRTSKELRCLKGTVPIIVKGNTWDIPLCLWLMETHPHIPPVCYIKPTRPMHLRPSEHIYDNGKVYHSYLHNWEHPESDLVGLLQTLVLDFGEIPPVCVIQNNDADITNQDILNVTQNFTDLRRSTDTYTFMDRTSKELRCLKGTVPIIVQGNTWNIPLCLWLMDTHPHLPPVCYIKPTRPMHLRPSEHIYDNGKVYHSYLQKWKHPESDLVGLLQTLVLDFGQIPPVHIIQDIDADITKRDILNVTQNFTDLRHSTDTCEFDDGTSKDLRCLKGTVPIIVKGNTWNIPLCLWLMETYPHVPPVCFIKPTANMHVMPGRYVDANGQVYHPYLQEWKHPESDLFGLLRIVVTEFGKRPPVVSIEASQQGPLSRTTTAETVVSGVEDVLQCVLCLDNMRDPRILNCHHSFCKSCLKKLLQTRTTFRPDRLTCPTCRVVTVVRERSVENLPVDFKMRKLCELLSQHSLGQK